MKLIKLKPEAIYDLWPVRRSLIYIVARRFKSLSTPGVSATYTLKYVDPTIILKGICFKYKRGPKARVQVEGLA